MSNYRTAGVLWLIAAVSSAASTIAFRSDSVWYAITLVASGVAAAVGVLLLMRATKSTVGLSTLIGAAWVAMYVVLIVDQIDDVQSWTANAFFALLGAVAAVIAYRAGQTTNSSR